MHWPHQTICQSLPFHQRCEPSLMMRQVWPVSSVHWFTTVGSATGAAGCSTTAG